MQMFLSVIPATWMWRSMYALPTSILHPAVMCCTVSGTSLHSRNLESSCAAMFCLSVQPFPAIGVFFSTSMLMSNGTTSHGRLLCPASRSTSHWALVLCDASFSQIVFQYCSISALVPPYYPATESRLQIDCCRKSILFYKPLLVCCNTKS